MITSPTGRLYVGSSINVKQRWRRYESNNCKEQVKLYRSLLKYGYKNHKFEIVWQGNISEMRKYETLIGWEFNVLEPENLNLQLPKYGDTYSCTSEETKNKMKKSSGHYKTNLGKKASEETKKKMSNSQKGKKMSKEAIEKTRLANIGRKKSQESKDKQSRALKGKKLSQKHIENRTKAQIKPIIQYDLQRNFIKEWESAISVKRELNFDNSSITKCCKGKRKIAYGFIWGYK